MSSEKISSGKKSGEKKTVAIRENFPPSSAQGQIIQGDCFVSLTIREKPDSFSKAFSASSARFDRNAATGLCVGSSPSILHHAAGDRTSCAVARGGRADLSFKLLLCHPGVVGFPYFFSSLFPLAFLPTSFH